MRAAKTVTSDGTNSQQLVLTSEEFEQMKRLMELQSKLHSEIQQQQQVDANQTVKLAELNLDEKLKLNELIKNQLQQIRQALTQLADSNSPTAAQQQQQLKEKYLVLLKKQNEIQALVQQQQGENSKLVKPVISQGSFQGRFWASGMFLWDSN